MDKLGVVCVAFVAGVAGFIAGGIGATEHGRATPDQPDVRLVTFPDQDVECYVYRDDMVCLPYTDNGVEGARHDR